MNIEKSFFFHIWLSPWNKTTSSVEIGYSSDFSVMESLFQGTFGLDSSKIKNFFYKNQSNECRIIFILVLFKK